MKDNNIKEQKGFFKQFNNPVKGVFDIALVMTITILAVVFAGPIVIQSTTQAREAEHQGVFFDHVCYQTGRPIKDYLVDEDGNVYGWIEIKYHDNGAFRQITEHREGGIIKVFYDEENRLLYWIEIKVDENGNVLDSMKFRADGTPMD